MSVLIKARRTSSEDVKTAYWKSVDSETSDFVEEGTAIIRSVWVDALAPIVEKLDEEFPAGKGIVMGWVAGGTHRSRRPVHVKQGDLERILAILEELTPKEIDAYLASGIDDVLKSLVIAQMGQAYTQVAADWSVVVTEREDRIRAVMRESLEHVTTAGPFKARLIRAVEELGSRATVSEITKRIRSTIKTYPQSGAERIARTTATLATNASQTDAWSDFPGITEILTRRDHLVRSKPGKSHATWDGLVKDEDGYYTDPNTGYLFPYPGSTMLPAGLVARCRCYQLFTPETP